LHVVFYKIDSGKEMKIMNIQTVGSSYIIQSPKGSYFQNLYKRVCALEDALKSGNQDRVTLSENPLAKTMTHIETNLAAITSDSPFYSGPTPIGENESPFYSGPTPIGENESPFYSGPTPIGENESPFYSGPTPIGENESPFYSGPTPIGENESPFYSGPTPIGENESPFSSQPTPVVGYGRSVQSQATASVMVLNITT
jgi:hypothetical protein